MSRERAVAAVNLGKTDRIPSFDGISSHPGFIAEVSGLDPQQDWTKTVLRCLRKLDADVIGAGVPSYGRTKPARFTASEETEYTKGKAHTKMGFGTTTWTTDFPARFPDVKAVLDYDPLVEERMPVEEIAAGFLAKHAEDVAFYDSRVLVSQGIYKSLFMWPVMTFGWEMFLLAAAEEPEAFGEVMDRFATVSKKYFDAWAEVEDLIIFSSHDDLAMTRGPVFNPSWYEKYVFPWYPKLWKPIKEKGVKIIFRADGNMDEFIDDLAACGADGFCIRKETNLKRIADKYGDSKIIIGNVDTRILTFGSKGDIEEEVKRCVREAGDCPGYFFQASGDIPYNVPLANVAAYFEACEKHGKR